MTEIITTLLWVALFAVPAFYWRKEITGILKGLGGLPDRLHAFGPAKFQQAVAKQAEKEEDKEPKTFIEPLPDEPSLDPWEKEVRRIVEESDITEPSDIINRLIRSMAVLERGHQYEFIRRSIFGSQFAALEELRSSGAVSPAALRAVFYEEHVDRVREADAGDPLTFLQWIGFLTARRLVELNEGGAYQLTSFGAYFLESAAKTGIKAGSHF